MDLDQADTQLYNSRERAREWNLEEGGEGERTNMKSVYGSETVSLYPEFCRSVHPVRLWPTGTHSHVNII